MSREQLLEKSLQFIRYLAVGSASALIELGVFWLLRQVLAVDTLFANPVAITLSTCFNFVLSRTWTFRSVSSLPRTIALYISLFVFNQAFSTFTIIQLEGLGCYTLVAKIITMACIVLWNFVLYRKVIFK
jgi:putative flippase GtrA